MGGATNLVAHDMSVMSNFREIQNLTNDSLICEQRALVINSGISTTDSTSPCTRYRQPLMNHFRFRRNKSQTSSSSSCDLLRNRKRLQLLLQWTNMARNHADGDDARATNSRTHSAGHSTTRNRKMSPRCHHVQVRRSTHSR